MEAGGAVPTKIGEINGEGVLISADGMKKGPFKGGNLNGYGEEIDPNGTWRGGTFQNGTNMGYVYEVRTVDGKTYIAAGSVVNGKLDGMIERVYADGSTQFEDWEDGQLMQVGTRAPKGRAALAPQARYKPVEVVEAEDAYLHTGPRTPIVASYGDPELAKPGYGWSDDRAAWYLAVEKANEVSRHSGSCTLIILRADGIGSGDPFVPDPSGLQLDDNVAIRVCGFSLSEELSISLQQARRLLQKHVAWLAARDAAQGNIEVGPGQNELKFVHDPRACSTRVYYCNPTQEPQIVRWKESIRLLGNQSAYLRSSDEWVELSVPAGRGIYLRTFVQGDDRISHLHWRFKIGQSRETRVGAILLGSDRYEPGLRCLTWVHYDPQPLRETDFIWMNAPALTTRRLRLRNWGPGDHVAYAQHCNTPAVMKWLGGVQTRRQLKEDVEYFAGTGLEGPTYWVVERQHDGELLGFCGALVVEEPDSPVNGEWEIGWRIREDAWGQGYALEAAHEALRFLIEDHKLEKVVARVAESNHASRRVAERLGMVENRERRHIHPGESEPFLIFEIEAQQYDFSATSSDS